MRTWATLLILAIALMAGCLSDDGGQAASGPGQQTIDEDAGTITGLVLDDEDQPVAGAQVALLGTQIENTTSADGRFTLHNVPAGTHTVAAQALGYETVSQRVTVTQGQASEILLRAVPIAVIEPHQETLIFDGHITCNMGLVVITIVTGCGTTGTPAGDVTVDPNEKNEFIQQGTPEHATIVAEVTWTQAAALAARELEVDLYKGWVCTPFCSWDENYGGQQGPSPVTLVTEGPLDGIEDEPADISHIVSVAASEDDPPFVIIVIQQDFTLFSTHFYGLPAPEGFSALPDA